jgi:hypothetical protein
MVREGGSTRSDRIRRGLTLVLIRNPEPREIEALAKLYERREAYYLVHPDEARALATDPLGRLPDGWDAPELAALTSVSNVILNLDEFLTRN